MKYIIKLYCHDSFMLNNFHLTDFSVSSSLMDITPFVSMSVDPVCEPCVKAVGESKGKEFEGIKCV